MPSQTDIIEPPHSPNFAPRMYGIALLVGAIVLTGFWLIARYTSMDLARDMQSWQEKLNLIAESRTAEVDHWVSEHFKELRTLGDNPSLQLYLTELQMMKAPDSAGDQPRLARGEGGEPAQKAYLRNLLIFTAQRAGFAAPSPVTAIPANVQPEGKNGLAIIDVRTAGIVVSTVMDSATRDMMQENVQAAPKGQETLIDIQKDKDGTPYIGFIVPIYSIQGDRNASSQIGWVVGIKTVDEKLFSLLKHPGITENTLETLLVRKDKSTLEYLSPLQDGAAEMSKEAPFDTAALAEAALVDVSGNFISDKKDYRGKTVLATSRSIANAPWTLIVKIDRQEALAQSSERRASMVVFFFLIIAIIVLIIVSIWWLAHSKRSMLMSTYFRHLAAQAVAQERLLRVVADNEPESVFIIDGNQTIHFANEKTAAAAHMSPESLPGKRLADVRGAAQASPTTEMCGKVLRQRQIMFDVQRLPYDGGEKVVRSAYVPLEHIPVVTLPDPTPGVLVVEQDISEVVHERERRLTTHRQLVETLVRLVDKRDPFAANHSQLVSQIAFEMALDMELDNVTVDTTHTAGCLMNIGKILIPAELLTKTDSLSNDEKRAIRDSMNAASDILSGISFDGPVAETLRQWPERWDGKGPLGLTGEQILISARIIAVANAFIGMISPRSWRAAMSIEAANKALLDQSDTHFDKRVVVALINYVENHHGKVWIKKILDAQKAA